MNDVQVSQVIQLLGAIRSSLQRLEYEVRDCRQRLGWPVVVHRADGPNANATATATPLPPETDEDDKPSRTVHTPAGRKAAARMRTLRVRLDASCREMGAKLGVSGPSISNIENGRQGISGSVHEAMAKLEESDGR